MGNLKYQALILRNGAQTMVPSQSEESGGTRNAILIGREPGIKLKSPKFGRNLGHDSLRAMLATYFISKNIF